jgi:hypothetical protein
VQTGSNVNCTGTAPNGFGDGTQSNLNVVVQPGALVIGTPNAPPSAINLLDGNTVTNAGTITSNVFIGQGISVNDNNVVVNTTSGVIIVGNLGTGILGFNNNTLINNGLIITDGGSGMGGFGTSVVINNGTINAGDFGGGITADSGGTAINNGIITAGVGGVGIQVTGPAHGH